jgi:hypothetical protein
MPEEEQEETEPAVPAQPGIETDEKYIYRANQRGDQFLRVSLMVSLPAKPSITQLFAGGKGTLGYMHFLNSFIAIGGDISFGYHATIGKNVFTYVPMMVRFMYQPEFRKFEFPLTIGLGGVFETYSDRTYFGMVVNPEIGAFYRIIAGWSAGLHFGTVIMPQWYSNSDYNYTGIMFDLGLTARYHF